MNIRYKGKGRHRITTPATANKNVMSILYGIKAKMSNVRVKSYDRS